MPLGQDWFHGVYRVWSIWWLGDFRVITREDWKRQTTYIEVEPAVGIEPTTC